MGTQVAGQAGRWAEVSPPLSDSGGSRALLVSVGAHFPALLSLEKVRLWPGSEGRLCGVMV